MRRRDFIATLGGAAAWPVAARAQSERVRRVALLMAHKEDDPEYQKYIGAFRQGLLKLGWIEGQNVRIDARWGALDDADQRQQSAKELLALQPDIILTQNTPPTKSMLQQTGTVPVIFVVVADPVGSGFVGSLARPGGNATGFTVMEPTTSAKWVELLKEIAPRINRAAFLFNPATAPFADYYLAPFKAAAASLAVQATTAPVHSKPELESVIAAQSPDTGLISMPDGFLNVHREELVLLAARYRLPAVYPWRFFPELGGCCLTAAISGICFGLPRRTSIASSGAKSQQTCRCRHRLSMSWSSTLRPPKRSALLCRQRFSPAPTR